MSALQDSLYGTDYGVALLSQEDTALHHTQSPRCSGSLLRGSLAITTTGLPPVSHQNLSRHTKPMLDPLLLVFLEERGVDLECLAWSQSKLQLLKHARELLAIDKFNRWRSISNGLFTRL